MLSVYPCGEEAHIPNVHSESVQGAGVEADRAYGVFYLG
jgi:hypothetical protein